MEKTEIIKYLKIERECISRDCDRNCGQCDLVQEQETLLNVYNNAINIIKQSITCEECMYDAPYHYCCKCECGEHEFCRNCNVNSRGTECPKE